MVIANEFLGVEKLDEKTRTILQKGPRHLRRIRDEEKAAEEILEEVKLRRQQNRRRHVDGARTIHCLG